MTPITGGPTPAPGALTPWPAIPGSSFTHQWANISPGTPQATWPATSGTSPAYRLATTTWDRECQPISLGASLDYQCPHGSWPCHYRRAHIAHRGGNHRAYNPRAYNSGDQRGVCCWAHRTSPTLGHFSKIRSHLCRNVKRQRNKTIYTHNK